MSGIVTKLGVVAAGAAERAAVSLLISVAGLGQRSAPRQIARGYSALLARSSLGEAVGRTIHRLGLATHPDRLMSTRADRRLRTLIAGRQFSTPGELTELERLELGTRHVGFAASSMLLWVIPFIYGTNPSRLRISPKEIAILVRRFRNLLASDMKNMEKIFPRDIAGLTHLDLDGKETAKAFATTHAAMLRAVRRENTMASPSFSLPHYFGQAFHWRNWQSGDSARSWDMQVDILFAGLYGAMERSLIPDILEGLGAATTRSKRILEVGGGTGSLANAILRTLQWRGQLSNVTLDFVEIAAPNMALAKRRLARWGDRIRFFDFETTGACAEKLPHENASLDILVVANLFHELPPPVRQQATKEFARVLRPGGRLTFLDSAQLGDDIDSVLLAFGGNGRGPLPRGTFHEPFYESYLREDLRTLFSREGLMPRGDFRHIYTAKQIVLQRSTP